jgi:hypothetical protein
VASRRVGRDPSGGSCEQNCGGFAICCNSVFLFRARTLEHSGRRVNRQISTHWAERGGDSVDPGGASLVSREGDFGFSPENGTPGEGHDVMLVNFSKPGQPLTLELTRFAFNCPEGDQVQVPGMAPIACPAAIRPS